MAKIDEIIKSLLKDNPLYGILLQQLKITKTTMVPTAGIGLNKFKKFELWYNQDFLNRLTLQQSAAVFKHEAMHFTHKHILMGLKYKQEDRQLLNIAMDMAINQFINNLPNGCSQCPTDKKTPCESDKCPGRCVDYKEFNDKNGNPLEPKMTTEYYYKKLKELKDKNAEENGEGEGKGELKDKHGKVWDKSFDSHEWYNDLTEEEKEELMKEMKKLLKRTKEKTSEVGGYQTNVDSIDDIIEEIDAQIAQLNYAKLLSHAVKKSLPSQARVQTWKRASRRYGYDAKGSISDEKPKIDVYLDTSGSISVDEYNKFLRHTDKFIAYANKKCDLYMFHEQLYHKQKYKTNVKIEDGTIQSGGTDLRLVLENIKKRNSDLAIIFTDGYYSDVDIKGIKTKIIFAISKNGTEEHPLKRYGLTVKLPN